MYSLARLVFCMPFDKNAGKDPKILAPTTPKVELLINAKVQLFDFTFTFPFHVFPQPLPVVILGLDFTATLGSATLNRSSEILVRLLATKVPGLLTNEDYWVKESSLR